MNYQDLITHPQFKNRVVVGHYAFAASFSAAAANQKLLQLQNPDARRRAHFVRLTSRVGLFTDVATDHYADPIFGKYTGTTAVATSGAAIADANYAKLWDDSRASVLVGKHAAALSGGTPGTGLALGGRSSFANPSAAVSGMPTVGEWIAGLGPCEIRQNASVQLDVTGSGAGVLLYYYEAEWLESIPADGAG